VHKKRANDLPVRRLRARHGQRGSLLIITFFLAIILLVMGIAVLTMQQNRHKGALLARRGLQAKMVAEAGIEDARIKIQKDIHFKPRAGDLTYYFYSESLKDPSDGSIVGRFEVTVDYTKSSFDPAYAPSSQAQYYAYPFYIVRVRSLGIIGETDNPAAKREIIADIDVCPVNRDASNYAQTNPHFYQVINWRDMGSP
jgi:hypothetical protein